MKKSKKAAPISAPKRPTNLEADVPERIYTWHEASSGWEAARVGYARQQAAQAAAWAKAMEPPPEVHGPPAPPPKGYDPIVNGLWDGRPKRQPEPSSKAAAPVPVSAEPPSYDYDRDDSWKQFVTADGEITTTPMSRGRYWGPV
jgi:hypothetical protein